MVEIEVVILIESDTVFLSLIL